MSTSPHIPEAQCQRLKEELFLSRPGTPVQGTSLSPSLSLLTMGGNTSVLPPPLRHAGLPQQGCGV